MHLKNKQIKMDYIVFDGFLSKVDKQSIQEIAAAYISDRRGRNKR